MKRAQKNKQNSKSQNSKKNKSEAAVEKKKVTIVDDDDDINSGFAEYMRSGDGMDMMKLFVMGNTMILFVTLAWPNIQQTFTIIRDYFLNEDN